MKAGEFETQLLDPGVYQFTLHEVKTDQKTAAGDPMISICWAEEETGAHVWDNLTISQKGAWRLLPLWLALGGSRDEEVGDLDGFAALIVNKVRQVKAVSAVVAHSEYQGKTRAKITMYKEASEAEKLMAAQGRGAFDREKSPF